MLTQWEGSALRSFLIRPLTPDLIERAFPVVQSALPDLSLDRWRAYAERVAEDPSGGITVALDEQGYVAGLFAFQALPDLRNGLVLAVRDLIAVDLVSPEPVTAALLDAIDSTAARRGCTLVLMSAPTGDAPVPPLFAAHGYRRDPAQFCKGRPAGITALRRPAPVGRPAAATAGASPERPH